MANVRDLIQDEEDEGFDWKDSNKPNAVTARRSLERYLEKRALKRQIQDVFDENDGDAELDW